MTCLAADQVPLVYESALDFDSTSRLRENIRFNKLFQSSLAKIIGAILQHLPGNDVVRSNRTPVQATMASGSRFGAYFLPQEGRRIFFQQAKLRS